jgi:hypothetical protein
MYKVFNEVQKKFAKTKPNDGSHACHMSIPISIITFCPKKPMINHSNIRGHGGGSKSKQAHNFK